jgi:hypothetical protein
MPWDTNAEKLTDWPIAPLAWVLNGQVGMIVTGRLPRKRATVSDTET